MDASAITQPTALRPAFPSRNVRLQCSICNLQNCSVLTAHSLYRTHRYLYSPALNLSVLSLHLSSSLRIPYRQSSSFILKSNPLHASQYHAERNHAGISGHILASVRVEIRSITATPFQRLGTHRQMHRISISLPELRFSLWWISRLCRQWVVRLFQRAAIDAEPRDRFLQIVWKDSSAGSTSGTLRPIRVASGIVAAQSGLIFRWRKRHMFVPRRIAFLDEAAEFQ
jgi:hypothetical protein